MNSDEIISSLELLDRIFKIVKIFRKYDITIDQLIKVAEAHQENPYFWKENGHLDSC